ncbi:MAG TPA: hypothetical protein VN643_13520 [Pyrinomonadaceae bacterium]|nr:hypothetical protein [Pyrinomonadaceae bacterium]
MPVKRTAITGPDELDILSAIWILACNDENPLISYEGIGVWNKYQQFAKLCYQTQKQREGLNSSKEEIPVKKDQFVEDFLKYKDDFRTELYGALFKYSE